MLLRGRSRLPRRQHEFRAANHEGKRAETRALPKARRSMPAMMSSLAAGRRRCGRGSRVAASEFNAGTADESSGLEQGDSAGSVLPKEAGF
jgi:hypothetical protein